ncbi:hypothetical protein [Cupriavidus sp. RAF12]|uniref:hypothetical protein n=1 Tax=Cupriavidus sp. RAF12 TaxID=3233050 RepID=UPI003F8E30CE
MSLVLWICAAGTTLGLRGSLVAIDSASGGLVFRLVQPFIHAKAGVARLAEMAGLPDGD